MTPKHPEDHERIGAPDGELPPLADHLRNRPDAPREHGGSQARLIVLLLFVVLPLLVVLVIVLSSLASGPSTAGNLNQGQATSGLNEVTRYCVYTAKSDDDYQACLDRTQDTSIVKQQTNAARYARGELDRCLADSGPRCTLR